MTCGSNDYKLPELERAREEEEEEEEQPGEEESFLENVLENVNFKFM